MTHQGMVHALQETWRVLRKKGILIDLRPLHSNVTIDVIDGDESKLLTVYADDWRHSNDKASDSAVARLVADSQFQLEVNAAFEYVKFYDTGQELLDYYAERNPPIQQPDDVVEKIRIADTHPDITLCVGNPMLLKTYRRMDDLR